MGVEDLEQSIATVEDLAGFIDALATDALEHGSEWENLQIFDMLESMAAWLRDASDDEQLVPPDLERSVLRSPLGFF